MSEHATLSGKGINVPVVSSGIRFIHSIIDQILVFGISFMLSMDDPDAFTLYAYVLMFGYYVVTEGLLGGSLAKLMLGNIVIDDHAKRINFGTAALRSIIRFVPLDGLSFLGSDSRGWHDKWSKTYVIKKGDLERVQEMLNGDTSFDTFGMKEKDSNFEESTHSNMPPVIKIDPQMPKPPKKDTRGI